MRRRCGGFEIVNFRDKCDKENGYNQWQLNNTGPSMRFHPFARHLAAIQLAGLLAACGGGGGGSASTPLQSESPPPPLPYPIPSGLWTPPPAALPASGNYIYLQSDSGDYIGGGRSYTYTRADALINVAASGLSITVGVQGNERWDASFLLPSGANKLQAGYFSGLTRAPFADKAVGGLDWGGEGRGCNTITGWVVIDKITLEAGTMTALDMRFEQHCEGGAAALHGQVHWTRANADAALNPVPAAIPAGLWQPAAGSVPASGSYLYLESRAGDYIGGGRSYLYTPSNASIAVRGGGAHLNVNITGDQNWDADFQGMLGMAQLTTGYYAGLKRYPFNNPVKGGLSFSGEGRGCNTLSGWFVVDKVTYSGGALSAIDLRFEQNCDNSAAPLHGQLHWVAGETASVPGPQNPPPAGLWTPPAGALPASGNYVYLQSDNGDYIGGGRTELLTAANSTINVDGRRTAALWIGAGGWTGDFVGMNTLSQLQPGYYGGLQRYPFHNPVRGGMDWSGNGRGCNTLSGWFVVDKVSYALGEMTAIDLRFEQHCEGGAAAQRGAIHWIKP
jgi:hypothetical protein